MSIVSGSEEEEVYAEEEFGNDTGDKDLEFVDEVLTGFAEDMQKKDSALAWVEKALEKGKRKIPEELRENACTEVKDLEEQFKKVVNLGSKFWRKPPNDVVSIIG